MGALQGCPCLPSALLPVRVKAAVRGSLFVRERKETGGRRRRDEKKKKGKKEKI
jgi:hypothetical protein